MYEHIITSWFETEILLRKQPWNTSSILFSLNRWIILWAAIMIFIPIGSHVRIILNYHIGQALSELWS